MTRPFPTHGRLAGIDFGTVRIGIAVTDPERKIASPCENYTRGDEQADAKYFRKLVESEQIVGFIVGLPVHMSGEESQKSHEARQFGKWLADVTGVPIEFYDERLTTTQASDILTTASLTKKKRKARLDMLAAQILLTSYLESSPAEPHAPGSLEID